MSRIKNHDTKPEIAVRSLLHRMGYRFRLHRKDLPGRPDIVLPKYSVIIFVHGCFWHRHEGCRFAYTPKSNIEFWTEKFNNNLRRDAENKAGLEKLGWNVKIIWECETNNHQRLTKIIQNLF